MSKRNRNTRNAITHATTNATNDVATTHVVNDDARTTNVNDVATTTNTNATTIDVNARRVALLSQRVVDHVNTSIDANERDNVFALLIALRHDDAINDNDAKRIRRELRARSYHISRVERRTSHATINDVMQRANAIVAR